MKKFILKVLIIVLAVFMLAPVLSGIIQVGDNTINQVDYQVLYDLDYPQTQLNNHSLREVFEVINLIPKTWDNRPNTNHAFVDDELVVTATADGTSIGLQKALNYSGNYYYAIVFKSDSLNTFNFAQTSTPLTILQTNVYQQNSGLKLFSSDTTFRLYQSLLSGQTFTVKYAIFIQTTSTVEQMDYWFNIYQTLKDIEGVI